MNDKLKFGCHVLQWGIAIDENTRSTWDGKIWQVSLPEALSQIAKLGFESFDCSDQDMLIYLSKDKDLKKIINDSGLELSSAWTTILPKKLAETDKVAINPNLPMTDHSQFTKLFINEITADNLKEYFDQEIEVVEKFVSLGEHVFTIGGPFMDRKDVQDKHYMFMGEALNDFGERCKKLEIRIAYHHHIATLLERSEDFDKLYDYADKNLVGLLFDTAHISAVGIDPFQFIDKYSDRIFHVHLKDIREGKFVELGEGELDLFEIIKKLNNIGYSDWMVVELDIPTYPAFRSGEISISYLNKVREMI